MNTNRALNPFQSQEQPKTGGNALVDIEGQRAIQEVQAAMIIAKKFPRDPMRAMDNILKACTRVTLAEGALYAYPRGGEVVTGPSIRLAEALAQNWGNISFGIRELSQSNGESTVEAFAWDIETNTRQVKVFQVPHKRYTRKGTKNLEDPRDIYEMVANQGARRLRACILGVIPGDVVDAAVRQSEMTMANNAGAPEDQIKKLVEAFKGMGVTKDMIVKRLGHHLDKVIAAEIISLRKIYASIKDGMSGVDDWFEKQAVADDLNEKLRQQKAKAQPAGAEEMPEEPTPEATS